MKVANDGNDDDDDDDDDDSDIKGVQEAIVAAAGINDQAAAAAEIETTVM